MGVIVGGNREGRHVPMFQLHSGSAEQSALSNAGDAPPIIPDDWRTKLQPHDRRQIVVKIMVTLKKHIPYEEFQELNRIAVNFEEKTYSASTMQREYLRKISLTMLTIGGKSQSQIANSLHTNAANATSNSSDLGNMVQYHYQHPLTGTTGLMHGNIWREAPQVPIVQSQAGIVEQLASSNSGGTPPMDPDNWRAKLPFGSRQRIVNKIVDIMTRLLPQSNGEGPQKINNLALKFEEKIYSTATSKLDYLKWISMKMHTLGLKFQTQISNSLQTNAALQQRRNCFTTSSSNRSL